MNKRTAKMLHKGCYEKQGRLGIVLNKKKYRRLKKLWNSLTWREKTKERRALTAS